VQILTGKPVVIRVSSSNTISNTAGAGSSASGAGGSSDGGNGNGWQLHDASRRNVENMEDALALLMQGEGQKHRAATLMNERSSRAHTLFVGTVTQTRTPFGSSQTSAKEPLGTKQEEGREGKEGKEGKELVIHSQLCIVDLAGSEQIKKSGVVGVRRKEAVGINSSLMVLGKCINALASHKHHVSSRSKCSRCSTLG
jgi:hypothetical protein